MPKKRKKKSKLFKPWKASPRVQLLSVIFAVAIVMVGYFQFGGRAASATTSTVVPGYYDTLVSQQGATAYWPLDEASGTSVFNQGTSGNTNNGLILGTSGTTYTQNVVGRGPSESALRLSGGYVNIANPTDLATPAISVAGWVRIPAGASGNGYVYNAASNTTDGVGLGVFSGVAQVMVCAANKACVTLKDTGVNIGDGNWHMLAFTAAAGKVTLYVDGSAVQTAILAGPVSYTATPEAAIGRSAIQPGNALTGDVGDVSVYNRALAASDVSAMWPAGACPQSTIPDLAMGTPPPSAVLPTLPLTTDGRYIVDKVNGVDTRVKLASVNWYGMEELTYAPAGLQCQPLSAIVANIKARGFNSVRLPWSTDSWNSNPVVPNIAVAANPSLTGIHYRNMMDAVVNELSRQGIMVILDNHDSRPDWCCTDTDGNALWWEDYNPASPPDWSKMTAAQKTALYNTGNTSWEDAWNNIVSRYSPSGSDPQRAVIGADLRNEPRNDSTLGIDNIWGGSGTPDYENWQAAATTEGDRILDANSNLLIMVEGVDYGTMLGGTDNNTDLPTGSNGGRGAYAYPVQLKLPNGDAAHQLVYSVHNYEWDQTTLTAAQLGDWWGYLLSPGKAYTAPVWIGEFGTCDTNSTNCLDSTAQGTWWTSLTSYMKSTDVDWSYWSLNGTSAEAASEPLHCSGDGSNGKDSTGQRFEGCADSYGILNTAWQNDADPNLTNDLKQLEAPTQKP